MKMPTTRPAGFSLLFLIHGQDRTKTITAKMKIATRKTAGIATS